MIPGTLRCPKECTGINLIRIKNNPNSSKLISGTNGNLFVRNVKMKDIDDNDGVVVNGDPDVMLRPILTSKIPHKEYLKCAKPKHQCHLLCAKENSLELKTIREGSLKTKLSHNLKTTRKKSTTSTPEKSEIMRMFEKIRKRRAEMFLRNLEMCTKFRQKMQGGGPKPPQNQ